VGSKSGVSKSIPVWTAAVPDQLSIGDDPDENYYNASTLTSSEFCIGLSSFTTTIHETTDLPGSLPEGRHTESDAGA
jgi:hypothetical protein